MELVSWRQVPYSPQMCSPNLLPGAAHRSNPHLQLKSSSFQRIILLKQIILNFIVKLCVYFLSMSPKDLKNGHRLTVKSLFTTTTPTMKLFLVSNERYGQINTFLLRYYGTDFASIKRYDQFCLFTVVYKEAQIHPLLTLSILLSCYSFCSFCHPSV